MVPASEGAAAIVIASDDLAKAKAASAGIAHGEETVSVPASRANGVIVSFIPN